jgi:hypothetical protein
MRRRIRQESGKPAIFKNRELRVENKARPSGRAFYLVTQGSCKQQVFFDFASLRMKTSKV